MPVPTNTNSFSIHFFTHSDLSSNGEILNPTNDPQQQKTAKTL